MGINYNTILLNNLPLGRPWIIDGLVKLHLGVHYNIAMITRMEGTLVWTVLDTLLSNKQGGGEIKGYLGTKGGRVGWELVLGSGPTPVIIGNVLCSKVSVYITFKHKMIFIFYNIAFKTFSIMYGYSVRSSPSSAFNL